MSILIRLLSFAIAFFILAYAVVAVSAAVYSRSEAVEVCDDAHDETVIVEPTEYTEEKPDEASESVESDEGYTPRVSAPDGDDPCYYSNDNIYYASSYGMPNCTCYAWGRAYELLGHTPELSPWDACTWYDYNKDNGCYDYGSEPRLGAIACWTYADGGSGHVAVVEDIGEDTVTFSNSAYAGTEFYTETAPLDDPCNGRENWILQGYIYVI